MLQADGCISIGEHDEIESLTMGRICSFYYLKHQTMGLFATTLKPEMDFKQVGVFMLAGLSICAAMAGKLPVPFVDRKLHLLHSIAMINLPFWPSSSSLEPPVRPRAPTPAVLVHVNMTMHT